MTPIGRRASLVASATALALSTGILLPTTPTTPTTPAAAATAAPGATPHTAAPRATTYDVTLVTGDVVHFADGAANQDTVTVDRPHGARGGVHIQQAGGETCVLPDEALPLLAAGKVDCRLFDVTVLVEMGYDDARSGGVPMIATYIAAARAARSLPAAPRGQQHHPAAAQHRRAALKARKKDTRAFWQDVAAAPAARSAGGRPGPSACADSDVIMKWGRRGRVVTSTPSGPV
ncbi:MULTISPECIES: hypothetical protein [unclassified Streptomyces]|uniref:hypothetical protein n=1 Tax=unclassified Streptomyces TaxID=2593676 RepID=UPI0032D5857C